MQAARSYIPEGCHVKGLLVAGALSARIYDPKFRHKVERTGLLLRRSDLRCRSLMIQSIYSPIVVAILGRSRVSELPTDREEPG